jgi:two-component system sensor histidine kinase KdpD
MSRSSEMDLDACWPAARGRRSSTSSRTPTSPGSRHAKRWQDVEELLDAGIDVLTTVNVQHLESLNDVVEQITGVPQRETVPDEVVRAAEQVELVDMTPEALRRRMAHGNIYRPEKIDAALGNYFRVGNLTALRELALLWLADKVDDQLDSGTAPSTTSRHLGDPGTGRRRADRRPRGRHADPPGRPDRRPHQGRRPAGRARHPRRRPGRRRPGQPGPAAAAGGEPRRHLPPGRRRRHPRGAARLRPRRQRHPARARRQPPRPARPALLAAGVGVTTTALSGSIDVHLVTHERGRQGRRRRMPAGAVPRRRIAGFARRCSGCRC